MPLIRKYNRLPKYDYSQANHYFITTCTNNKKEWFGEIKNNGIALNQYGKICLKHLQKLPNHYGNLEIDTFVIMPNHIHAIFIINNSTREGHRPSPTYSNNNLNNSNNSLTDIMRGFKTFSANQINKLLPSENKFIWQRSFHDHIIRNERSLKEIREYIVNNPTTWAEDEENINIITSKQSSRLGG